jgi:hypothetical protein
MQLSLFLFDHVLDEKFHFICKGLIICISSAMTSFSCCMPLYNPDHLISLVELYEVLM